MKAMGTVRIWSAAMVLAATIAVPAAHADGPRNARYVDSFTTNVPGASTGRHAETDITNPDDPDAKPPAIQRVLVEFAAGTRIDTDAIPQCTATDAELVAQGAAACPEDTVVGRSDLTVDTGFPEPGRYLANDVTLINADEQLILLARNKDNGSNVPVRGRIIDNDTLQVDVPPLPGTPPDGGADTLETLDIGERTGYMTTPPTCPANGKWTNRLTYTFRDGVQQSFEATSPCEPQPGPAPDTRKPRVRITHVPKRCTRRPFTARVRIVDASPLANARVTLDRRTLRHAKSKRFRQRIRAAGRGSHRLTVIARDASGNRARRTATFRRC